MVTRRVNEGATVHAPSLIYPVNNPLLPRLLIAYQFLANGHHTLIVTRRVNEEATVHASSLIDPVNNPLLPR